MKLRKLRVSTARRMETSRLAKGPVDRLEVGRLGRQGGIDSKF